MENADNTVDISFAGISSSDASTLKPGYKTLEGQLAAVIAAVVPLLTIIFHKDFEPYAPVATAFCGAIASIVYTKQRTDLKKQKSSIN